MMVQQTVRRDFPVPPLSMQEIAAEADAVLEQYERHIGQSVTPPIEIEEIVQCVAGLAIVFDAVEAEHGENVLGGLVAKHRKVLIDHSLDERRHPENVGRYRFTLAHELGHWVLHRKYVLAPAVQKALFGEALVCENLPEILWRSFGPRPPVERQADQFAGCLLMPEWLLRPAWRRFTGGDVPMSDVELARTFGDVDLSHFDAQLGANRELFERRLRREMFCLPLAERFVVSDEAMRIQLEDLGLFVDRHQPTLF